MSQRVNLDAMIPREDFARTTESETDAVNLIKEFPISHLEANSPVRRLLRKPDFQRETNHWSPEQMVMFVESFLDNDVIPSLILWKSDSYIFVIDGGHRLSALRAWMSDDYGDGAISHQFYNGEISDSQKKIAKRTRTLVEKRIGRFTAMSELVGQPNMQDARKVKRAGALFTRSLQLQWVSGSPEAAESSFFKINSQGTPLDDVEQMLIVNRSKPIAIGARAIVRAGRGHRYWSKFGNVARSRIENLSDDLFHLLFKPEVDAPLRTLDIPLGGAVSPVDSLSLIIDFLAIADSVRRNGVQQIGDYPADDDGAETTRVLQNGVNVARRITGNAPQSLGVHPAVYFYNERGRPSRFLFLGFSLLVAEKLRNNDDNWFRKFTSARALVEEFLVREKSLIGLVLQNMGKKVRVSKMRDLFSFLVDKGALGDRVTAQDAIDHLGVQGRIFDGGVYAASGPKFTDDAKSMVFITRQLAGTQRCSVCDGYLDAAKSMSYDHSKPVSKGGLSGVDNLDLLHPFCNTGIKVDK